MSPRLCPACLSILVSEISAESKIFPFFSSQNAFSSVTLLDVENTHRHTQKKRDY